MKYIKFWYGIGFGLITFKRYNKNYRYTTSYIVLLFLRIRIKTTKSLNDKFFESEC